MLARTLAVALPLLSLAACVRDESSVARARQPSAAQLDPELTSVSAAPTRPHACEERIAAAGLEPPVAREDAYELAVAYTAVAAPVVPILYLEFPRPTTDQNAAAQRDALERAGAPRHAVRDLVRRRLASKAFLREVVLSEGYLFTDDPRLARAFVEELRLEDLFDEPVVFRHRSGRIERLERASDRYVDATGQAATLLLGDRLAVASGDLGQPLHVDLEAVRAESGALRTRPLAVGPAAAALVLTFPDGSSRPALVEIQGAATRLACIGGPAETLEATRRHASRFWQRHAGIVAAAQRLVDERPRFDEPIGEPEGVQEDGQLRLAWRGAYYGRATSFVYRDVEYPVFDGRGQPVPPQVCVDFVLDTWERAAGTWYRGRGDAPGRTDGAVDFSKIDGLGRRSLASILAFAAEPGAPIERYDVPRPDRVPLARDEEFVRALLRVAPEVREGDAVVIHGLRLQDMREHYHSAIVLRTEPLTGVPMLVADNQGRPRIGSLVTAMRAAPLRSIKHRLRVTADAA